ncbi:flagellar biosynthesis protein FliQ [Shumkonia mesophila]|uniref:flagellar biosynthesis protein FliQ n=1 Tax=Shumkonia mesophila TaxID=2838854 RepID=UPI002934934D|nr:flagellar biosynthesis protein FliQ [Shumkonia mesophila]
MTEVTVLDVGRDAMIVVLKLSLPLLIATLVVGLIIALFQALTSIQEMTLTFVPKIVVVFVGLIVFLPFMMRVIVEFGERLFDRIVGLGLG